MTVGSIFQGGSQIFGGDSDSRSIRVPQGTSTLTYLVFLKKILKIIFKLVCKQ